MYTSFFGLTDKPFSITPDPRYLFMSERHAEALAHLLYGINEAGGFIQLTGEVGTGKTTIVRTLLERLPEHADVAVILNPRLTPIEFLLAICQELGIFVRDEDEDSVKGLVDILNMRLLAAHAKARRVVVIVDEAQNLSPETLEQVRLLTNLETATHKLLQIILIGQPELRTLLEREDLRQLAQRITGRYHLDPLSRDESTAYVKHRLKVAGSTSEIFTPAALNELHQHSRGIPRLINIISDRALLGGYTEDQHRITPKLVRRAAEEVHGKTTPQLPRGLAVGGAVAAVLALSAFGVWRLMRTEPAPPTPVVAAAPAPVEPAPVVAAEPPRPAPLNDLTEILRADAPQTTATDSGETTNNGAFASLFAEWGSQYDTAKGRACDQALSEKLQCVFQKGTWALVRQLNRPAILTLTDTDGNTHQVVLTALDDESAKIRIGETTHDVTIAALSRYWFGEFLILWRPHTREPKALSIGNRDEGVRWLRRSLYTALGQPVPAAGSDTYDEELAAMVEEFQHQHRLDVDGVAGLQTQLLLDSLTSTEAPLLLSPAKGG
ncbi:MAG: AAA family ATPase [Steroidobacteraceae bacterium]